MNLGKFFKSIPLCEVCQKGQATSFSYFEGDKSWKFCCDCTIETETYYVPLREYVADPTGSIRWLTRLNQQSWMNWPDFMAMLQRFSDAADCH